MSLRFVLLGHPVAHSMSPAIHTAAYAELGVAHRYDLVDAATEEQVAEAVGALRRGEIAGANVTIPWKRVALRLADVADASASAVGAANVLVKTTDRGIVAYNTDVVALRDELGQLQARPGRIVVIGSGGAALAAVASSLGLGAEVGVVARRFRSEAGAKLPGSDEFLRLGALPLPWPEASVSGPFDHFVRGADLIVQATSAGMHGADAGDSVAELIPWAALPEGSAAYDLVYNPPVTPFLRAARAAGHRAQGGLGMLVGQARAAIELWLGARVAAEPLLEAASRALGSEVVMKKRSEWRASVDGPWPFVHTAGELEPSEREWLHTNGAGAYAMSTVALMHTRRHHGALVAALDPPLGRHVIVSHAETTVNVDSDKRTYRLSTHQFPSVAPTLGYRLVDGFYQDPLPRWVFRLGSHTLERTLGLVRGYNAVVIAYTWRGKAPARISVKPLMPLRAVDALMTEHGGMMQVLTLRPGSVELQPVPGLPSIHIAHEGVFMGSPDWWRRFEYLADRNESRGFQEDMWTPGTVEMQLEPDKTAHLMIGIGPQPAQLPGELLKEARDFLLAQDPGPEHSPAARVLSIAAEQFCLEHLEPPLIIAGYPWHTLFTRDVVMAIPGLLLARDKVELAKRVIDTTLSELRYGLLPETLVEMPGGKRAHPSPDATLWLFEVARELVARVGARDPFVEKRVYPALVRVFARVVSGRRRWVWLASDGLLTASEPGVALTWMDAKIAGQPVTPRYGVPVELQALWTKGTELLASLAKTYGHERMAARAAEHCARTRAAFRARFWCADSDYPYDCLSEARDAADAWSDASIRPNALIALTVDPDLFDDWQAEALLETVNSDLLTPRGLRSLAPSGRRYVGNFAGAQEERELAYHQGTAWPYLLGMYARTRLRMEGEEPGVPEELVTLLERAVEDAVVLGQVAQLADGDLPHRPRGCPAQATSVAELLRALTLLGR